MRVLRNKKRPLVDANDSESEFGAEEVNNLDKTNEESDKCGCKKRIYSQGPWLEDEEQRFDAGFRLYRAAGTKKWANIAAVVGTRSNVQVRDHAKSKKVMGRLQLMAVPDALQNIAVAQVAKHIADVPESAVAAPVLQEE